MLSTAISDEIYNKTLGVLMTTPINSFQIVFGKLFSKILQLIILLAISLPLLAIVRVFGGVPWQFLIAGLSITLSTVILFASITLFFSILSKRAYAVIIITIITLAALFALVPLLAALFLLGGEIVKERHFEMAFRLLNPYFELGFQTDYLFSARRPAFSTWSWMVNCAVMLTSAAFILLISVFRVRRAALAQIAGPAEISFAPSPATVPTKIKPDPPPQPTTPIRRVGKNAALWKELRLPLFSRHKVAALVIIFAVLFVLSITYLATGNSLDEDEVQVLYVLVFAALGTLFSIVIPSTCITSEKEARSWPLLMATTLTDSQILFAKIISVLRRSLPAWILLFGHVLFFTCMRIIHPVAIFQLALSVSAIVMLFCASGIYFSSRFKRTTTAVIMNFIFTFSIWVLAPLLTLLLLLAIGKTARLPEQLLLPQLQANPFIQLGVIIEATVGRGHWDWHSVVLSDLRYQWPDESMSFIETSLLLLLTTTIYFTAAALFLWRAARRFRRSIF
jgi:ABC-type transport system involved in multi-copper enzyme maturation permease subunit